MLRKRGGTQTSAPRGQAHYAKTSQRITLKARPIDGIWLTGEPGSFDLFSRLYRQRAGVVFGTLAEALGAPAEPDDDVIEEPVDDPESWAYKMALERAKALMRTNLDKVENKRKLFDDILMHCSLQSEQRIRRHAGYEDAETNVSPWRLWNILRDTHLVRQFVGRIGLIGMRRDLVALHIGRKSIDQHSREFKTAYDTLVAMGDDVITDQAAADFFLTSLGPDFAPELNKWGRDDTIPENLDDAIREATLYLESERNATKMMEKNSGRDRGTRPREDKEVALAAQAVIPPGTHICPHCKKIAKHAPEQCYEAPFNKKASGGGGPKKIHAAAQEEASSASDKSKKGKATWSINISVLTASDKGSCVIFDNGANTNLWNNMRDLVEVVDLDIPVSVSGVGSLQATKKGVHPNFGMVYVALDFWTCIVSQFAVKKDFYVRLHEEDYYSLESKSNHSIYFFVPNAIGLYEWDMHARKEDFRMVNLERIAPRVQDLQRANRVRDFCRHSGHPGKEAIIRAIKSGSLLDIDITVQDVRMAERLLGPCVGCLHGKSTKSKVSNPREYDIPEEADVDTEILHSDFFFLPGKSIILVSVGENMRYITISRMPSKSLECLQEAWSAHLVPYSSRGIVVSEIHTDNEAVLGASKVYLSSQYSITLLQRPSEAHEPYVERRIRVIKERVRCILDELRYYLPLSLYWYVVIWAIQGINCFPDTLNIPSDVRSAREKVYGLKVSAKLLGTVGFGDPVTFYSDNKSHNNLGTRSDVGVIIGRDLKVVRYKVFCIRTQRVYTRGSIKPILLTNDVVADMNLLAHRDEEKYAKGEAFARLTKLNSLTSNRSIRIETSEEGDLSEGGDYEEAHAHDSELLGDGDVEQYEEVIEDSDDDDSDYVPDEHESFSSSDDDDYEIESSLSSDEDHEPAAPEEAVVVEESEGENVMKDAVPVQESRYPIKRDNRRANQKYIDMSLVGYVEPYVNVTQASVAKALKERPEAASKAIKTEFSNLLDSGTFEPVDKSLSPVTIPCHMFVVEKFDADGNYVKDKARCVGGGDKQEWDPDQSAGGPTPHWETILCSAALATVFNLTLSTIDTPFAFLQCDRENQPKNVPYVPVKPVYIRIPAILADMLLEVKPEWKVYQRSDNTIVVRAVKALYGLKESGLLWYNLFTSTMLDFGLVKSTIDPCLFLLIIDGVLVMTVVGHVDDCLVAVRDKRYSDMFEEKLTERFGKMSTQHGDKLSFIGVAFVRDRSLGKLSVSCRGFTESLLSKFGTKSGSPTPFPSTYNPKVIYKGKDLESVDRTMYLSMVMSVMYLANRCRPDVKYAATALATKSQDPKVGDLKLVQRLLRYLYQEPNRGIVYDASRFDGNIHLYADVSFNHHIDGRSHGGTCIEFSGGMIHTRSWVIKLVVKDSDEGEIITCDASIDPALWIKELLAELGLTIETSFPVYQDNSSAIVIMSRGNFKKKRSSINVRFSFIMQLLQEKIIHFVKIGTLDMKADGLTKALFCDDFKRSANQLTNVV